jgi:ABC-type Zn uptake system ZnuABC Zn-binding protein ZnuA
MFPSRFHAAALLLCLGAAAQAPAPLRVCVTTPDLAALCSAVGGDDVAVTALVRGPEDAHFLLARPSMLRELSRAELLVDVGRELEIGWLPLLVDNARNAAILPGGRGRLVAGDAVRVLGLLPPSTDRSHGDVHASGNPHFLLDPLCGLQVAAAIEARLAELRPQRAAAFAEGRQRLRREIAIAMVGEAVAGRYGFDAEGLAKAFGKGTLDEVLSEHGDGDDVGGWFAAMRPFRGAPVVADHDLWPYFAERFGLRVVELLEPRPGVAPTTAHLGAVIEAMRRQQVTAILTAPYFAPRHAEFVAERTGARVAKLAHQVGALRGCDTYVAFVEHNVRELAAALGPR